MTKYRRSALDADVLRSRQRAMPKAYGDFGADLREFNGEDDHAQLVAAYRRRRPRRRS